MNVIDAITKVKNNGLVRSYLIFYKGKISSNVFSWIVIALSILLFCTPSFAETGNIIIDNKDQGAEVPVTLLPADQYALVDWAKSVEHGLIKPADSISGIELEKSIHPKPFLIKSQRLVMTDVLFSHDVHAYWLNCKSCHPSPFPEKKGGTKDLKMLAIFNGEFCGKCHGKVAFRLKECYRCHLPRDEKKRFEAVALMDYKVKIYAEIGRCQGKVIFRLRECPQCHLPVQSKTISLFQQSVPIDLLRPERNK